MADFRATALPGMRPVIAAPPCDREPPSAGLFHKARCGWLDSLVFSATRGVEQGAFTKLFTSDRLKIF
jgi:hypothetical protein